MRAIPVDCIRDGSSLAKTIYDMDGRILLKQGVKISDIIKKKLNSLNVNSVSIIDEISEKEIKSIIQPELRKKAIKLIRETFANAMRLQKVRKLESLDTISKDDISEDDSYIKSIGNLANELIENLLDNNELMYSLIDIRNLDPYTYEHSLNVAVTSLVMGIGLKMNIKDLIDLAMAALLHDIGKAFISKDIIIKKGPLSFSEYKQMQQHPKRGYDYLKDNKFISAESRVAILQHHERFDGNGYPNRLQGNQISLIARIICIADVYDALLSNRSYKQPMSPNEAMEYIMANSGTAFDHELVKLFARIFVPYPNGTKVFLSNDEAGLVLNTLPNFPLRPNVLITESNDDTRIGKKVSLINELSLVIQNCEKASSM